MIKLFLDFTIKDWLIVAALFILAFCVLEVRKLKKIIAETVRKQLIPQLLLELSFDKPGEDAGFYLKNESFFLAQDIQVEELEITLDDFGFKRKFNLQFESVDFLKAQDRIKLKFKVFVDSQFSREITEKIIPHLISPDFNVRVRYSNIEGLKFYVTFFKKRGRFHTERIESLQSISPA